MINIEVERSRAHTQLHRSAAASTFCLESKYSGHDNARKLKKRDYIIAGIGK